MEKGETAEGTGTVVDFSCYIISTLQSWNYFTH